MTKFEKIKRVQDATGVDAATAQGYLEAEEWIVSDAVESVRADRRPAAPQPAEVKKLDDGRLAVRWQGKAKFNVIEDEEVAQYLIFWMIKGKDHDSGMLRAA